MHIFRTGNILLSLETQTTEERTQLYHAEIDALYKELIAKGKMLVLSAELGVRSSLYLLFKVYSLFLLFKVCESNWAVDCVFSNCCPCSAWQTS